MSFLRAVERLFAGGMAAEPQQQQQQRHQQECDPSQQEQQRRQRQREKEAAKAAAAAQRQAGGPAPKPPKGPCGRPCRPPAGGILHLLPLASVLQRGQPPWFAQPANTRLAQLLPGQDVLRVFYPAGSSTPSSSLRGGLQLRAEPRCLPARDVLLRFSFATAPNFQWTRGGKLGGGLHIGRGAAAGYRHSDSAASARLTWGPNGFLQLYVYTMEGTQQDPAYAAVAKLGGGCGDHLFPGTFQVQQGVWNEVIIRVRLNTPGQPDGVAGLGVNGQYREYERMVWRLDGGTMITQALISTFFGGSWSTPVDTTVDFAGWSLTVLE